MKRTDKEDILSTIPNSHPSEFNQAS